MKTTLKNEGVSGAVAVLLLVSAPLIALVIAFFYLAVAKLHF
jgi:hypothetical protein